MPKSLGSCRRGRGSGSERVEGGKEGVVRTRGKEDREEGGMIVE